MVHVIASLNQAGEYGAMEGLAAGVCLLLRILGFACAGKGGLVAQPAVFLAVATL